MLSNSVTRHCYNFSLVAFSLSLTLKFLLHFSFACESPSPHPCQACFYMPLIISFVFLDGWQSFAIIVSIVYSSKLEQLDTLHPVYIFSPFGALLCCNYCGTIIFIWILCVWDKDIVKSCDMDGEEVQTTTKRYIAIEEQNRFQWVLLGLQQKNIDTWEVKKREVWITGCFLFPQNKCIGTPLIVDRTNTLPNQYL